MITSSTFATRIALASATISAGGVIPREVKSCCGDRFIVVGGKVVGAEVFLEIEKYVIALIATINTDINIKTTFFLIHGFERYEPSIILTRFPLVPRTRVELVTSSSSGKRSAN